MKRNYANLLFLELITDLTNVLFNYEMVLELANFACKLFKMRPLALLFVPVVNRSVRTICTIQDSKPKLLRKGLYSQSIRMFRVEICPDSDCT